MTRLAELISDYNETKRRPDEVAMSQARLAEIVGLSSMTVHRHVNSKTSMDLQQAAAYARALGVDLEELVEA